MTGEEKKSVLGDILKRERLDKMLRKDKVEDGDGSGQKSKSPVSHTNQTQARDINNRVKSSQANTSYDSALQEILLDIRYYFLKEGDYNDKFREIYFHHKIELEKYGINAKKFIEYARESFDRYKKTNDLMPLEPMKPKAYKYVESSIQDLVKMLGEKFGKS